MPDKFWLIEYGELVWDRELVGFVPPSILKGKVLKDIIPSFWFLEKGVAVAQLNELKILGANKAKISVYNCEESDG